MNRWSLKYGEVLRRLLWTNMASLIFLMALAFALPLSAAQRRTLIVVEAFVFGLNAALLQHARKKAHRTDR